MSERQERPDAPGARARPAPRPAAPVHADDLLRRLDRVSGAWPTAPSTSEGLAELRQWMAQEPPPAPGPAPRPPSGARGTRPEDAARPVALDRLNALPADEAEALLLRCCASPRWARRLAAHRPFPDLGTLLAAADEAGYDLSPDEIAAAAAAEDPSEIVAVAGRVPATWSAVSAAMNAYRLSFGHAFVICLDDIPPDRRLDHLLHALRTRISADPADERVRVAEELRGSARHRLTRLIADAAAEGVCGVPEDAQRRR